VLKASDVPFSSVVGHGPDVAERHFRVRGDQRYSLECLPAGIVFDVDRLRRTSHELWGELQVTVPSTFHSAKTVDGVLVIGDMNFSSVQARQTRSKLLAERAGVEALDWYGYLEEFATKVISAERLGSPEVNLRSVPRPAPDRMFTIDGVELPQHHPTIVFGDGGTAKSYLCLYWAGRLMQGGAKVLYADWEFTAEEHRERLELLFGPDFPAVRYLPCYRPITDERDRIARALTRCQATYLICDSIAVACGADPSGSDAATSYFQAIRALGRIGSLHIAHVTKGGDSSDQKPFGSAFWHNLARLTLNVKAEDLGVDKVAVALYPRKRNLRGRGSASAFTIEFGSASTTITRTDVREHVALVEGLPLAERVHEALKYEAMTRKALAEALNVPYDLLQRTVHREIAKGVMVEFDVTPGGAKKVAMRMAVV
jgi:hypothetical protein